MSPADPFTDPLSPELIDPAHPSISDPPPPYPSPGRRTNARSTRHPRRSRRATQHSQQSSNESEYAQFPTSEDETAPLLSPNHHQRRQRTRTLSTSTALSSTSEGTLSIAPSLSHTVFSIFQSDIDIEGDGLADDEGSINQCMPLHRRWPLFSGRAWKRYFRPLCRKLYWKALLHLLVINFPYALAAWVYLFVFTLVSKDLY
jgi:hypothetical protein